MRIERKNSLGKAEAIRRIDNLVESLMASNFPGGVRITDAEKRWADNTMHFSFKASKGFFGTTIDGVVNVDDDNVVLESELPGVVRSLVGEEKIRDVVGQHLDELLTK